MDRLTAGYSTIKEDAVVLEHKATYLDRSSKKDKTGYRRELLFRQANASSNGLFQSLLHRVKLELALNRRGLLRARALLGQW